VHKAKPWRLILRSLGCEGLSWAGWALVVVLVLFFAITARLLVLKRSRQTAMSRTERALFEVDAGHSLSVLSAGNANAPFLFVLVHGASREFQNAEHWLKHLPLLSQLGRVLAVDMLGHGAAVPGPKDQLPAGQTAIPVETQVQALKKLIEEKKGEHQTLVLVGRSYGGRVVVNLANKLPNSSVHKIILIAPALREDEVLRLTPEVKNLPILFFWAEDDQTVSYARKKALVNEFPNKEVVLFGPVVQEGQEEWQAHTPESIKVEEFQNKIQAWLAA